MRTTEKIGVFICECGPNIKEAVDLEALSQFAKDLPQVVMVKVFSLLCSKEGKDLIIDEIQKHNLTRVVVAACSPKEHEKTFRSAAEAGGLNPYLIQIANIREQCAWVIDDRDRATEKAKAHLGAAVRRVLFHTAIFSREIDCQPDVLVVGAGVAGISAALTLAQKQRKVFLVEKQPCVGGKVALLEDLCPSLECASCVLDPWLDEVLHHPDIEVMTLAEISEVRGFYGNFEVAVVKKARYVDEEACIGCRACFEACPVSVKNAYNEGLDERKAVYIPYEGALPNLAVIDKDHCLRWKGDPCTACQEACPFGAIRYDQEDGVVELHVGAAVLATGFDLFDTSRAPQYGYNDCPEVYTAMEFERLLNGSGPTQGKIVRKDGRPPASIALVHCVGSRTKKYFEHCSSVCCLYLTKYAHQVRAKLPDVSVSALFSELCLPGKEGQAFFDRVHRDDGVALIRLRASDAIEIIGQDEGVQIRYTDVGGQPASVTADMVVLAPAMIGAEEGRVVAQMFGLCQDEAGFMVEDQAFLAPVSTLSEGVFVAGCAQGPQDIPTAVAQGQATAGKILSVLVPGEKLVIDGATAVVDRNLCAGCKTCISACPYKAIEFDEEAGCAVVNEVMCRRCGVCAATCPSGAMTAKHFTDEEIFAEIKGLGG